MYHRLTLSVPSVNMVGFFIFTVPIQGKDMLPFISLLSLAASYHFFITSIRLTVTAYPLFKVMWY